MQGLLRVAILGFVTTLLLAMGSVRTAGNPSLSAGQEQTATGPFTVLPEPTVKLRLQTAAGVRVLSVTVEHTIAEPGHDTAYITVQSVTGKLLSRSQFPTGHRLTVRAIEKAVAPGQTEELVCVRVGPQLPMAPLVQSEYLALYKEKPVLVRLEGGDRRIYRDYMFQHQYGPDPLVALPIEKVDQEARRWLDKGTWSQRLAVLTWLAAMHEDKESCPSFIRPYRPIVNKLQTAPSVFRLLANLRQSKDPWTHDAATLPLSAPAP